MNFLKRHLNWTLFIVEGLAYCLLVGGIYFMPDNYEITMYSAVGISIFIKIWHLHNKGRSQGYVFLGAIGVIGLIIMLCLKNHSIKDDTVISLNKDGK